MIGEKIELKLNIPKLTQELESIVHQYPPVQLSSTFGGWAVTSSNGSYLDGWGENHIKHDVETPEDIQSVRQQLKNRRLKDIKNYKIPTEICQGYLKEIMQQISELGFYPRRARLTCLKAESKTSWHRDAPDWLYYLRLHIPIVTNKDSYFECEKGVMHMPADGSGYLVHVNRMHQYVNNGFADRFHLIMDAWDSKKISQNHKYEDLEYLKQYFDGADGK